MFKYIYLRELKNNLTNVSFYIFTLIFFIITFLFASNTDLTVGIAMPIGKEWHNAPLVIARFFAFMSVYGLLFTIIMVGRSVTKDFSSKIHDFFFTIPMTKLDYLGGRFLGGLTANILIFLGVISGFFVGCLFIDHKFYGPFSMSAFLIPIIVILIPNLLFIGSIFFSLATLTRKMVMTYVAGVGALAIYGFISIGLTFVENDTIRILSDPFSIASLSILTKFWTIAEINMNSMPLSELLILNRIIWLSLSFTILYYTLKKFKFVSSLEGQKSRIQIDTTELSSETTVTFGPVKESKLDDSNMFQIVKCLHLTWREIKRILFHPAFLILTFLAMVNVFINFLGNVDVTGNSVYPLTSWFLKQTNWIWVYTVPLIILFGGMIVWRERDNKCHQFYDTLPLATWINFVSKFFTLAGLLFFFNLMIMLTGILTQILYFGWMEIELGLYVKYLFGINFVSHLFMIIIVLIIQNLVHNKYLGFFVCALYFIADALVFEAFNFDNILLRYGHIPKFTFSNLNGFGNYAPLIFWYTVYWALLGIFLCMITSLLWRRNEETHLKYRIRVAAQSMSGYYKIVMGISLILFSVVGFYIFCNKYFVNHYLSRDDTLKIQAQYEKKYSKYEHVPQPKMQHISLQVDFYPEKKDAFIKGYYILKNNTHHHIDTLFITFPERKISKINQLEFSEHATLIHEDIASGFRMFELTNPLKPGNAIWLQFDIEARTKGFSENNPINELVRNGSHITFSGWGKNDILPSLGYINDYEIKDNDKRKKYNLPKCRAMPPLEAPEVIESISFITYEALVSTNQQQTALTNGDLVKQWSENGRNYFHYKSDVPMLNDIVIASGEYEVVKEQYYDVTIEVYYHKKHPWNIDRILAGAKTAFDYCSTNFSTYKYSTLKIIEIPDYEFFGASYQPSLILWNENAGFISNIKEQKKVDMLFAITTHEITHNWWPCIFYPANAEGSVTLMSETIAQYVMVMCLEKQYGVEMARRHLKREMDRYLRGRKRETKGERPLYRNSDVKYYSTYAKSTAAMYALQNYIGEDAVNRALNRIIENYGYRNDLHVKSTDVLAEFRAVTSDSLQYLITDLFETITLFDNNALEANFEQLQNGKYKVNLKVTSHKFRADSIGTQTEIPIDDYIDIVVLSEDDKELYLKKHKFTQNEISFEIIVDHRPFQAGIDPHIILIDRNRDNNLIDVKKR